MTKSNYILSLFFAFSTFCSSHSQTSDTKLSLSDKKSTKNTVKLYENLNKTTQKGILFGHQDDLAYGVNWKYEAGRSDVKDVVGDFPAVYGWDLGGLESKSDKNIDGIPFDKMRQYIIDGHNRGGVITISWHPNNPLTGGNAWDTTPKSLVSALPGGVSHEKFKTWLDEAAKYILTSEIIA